MKRYSVSVLPASRRTRLALLLLWGTCAASAQLALPKENTFLDLADMSLEDLLQVSVTSVSRREESLFGAPAAIYTLSGDEAHRLGAHDLPTALRAVPGVQVGRISSQDTALSPRGFNDVSANKLLALVDGRSIYTPLFGGVQWLKQDLVMADLARIEVIRGPGSTLWGANAVNGVVNISTKSAHETLGTLVQASVGNSISQTGVVRHGFAVDNTTDARVYAQTIRREAFDDPLSQNDSPIDSYLAGFRLDRRTRNGGKFTTIGNWSQSHFEGVDTVYSVLPPYFTPVPATSTSRSGNLLARYEAPLGDETDFTVQAYVDRTNSDRRAFDDSNWINDIETTLHFTGVSRHDIVTGAGVRYHTDDVVGSEKYNFIDRTTEQWLFTAFVQDEYTLVPDHFTVTGGTKIEHNDYTGWEVQPGLRAAWREGQKWTLWGSVARAVRTPSRAERGTTLYPQVIPPNPRNPLPTQIEFIGNPAFEHEELVAWEAGWRAQLNEHIAIDVAAFINDYDGIRTVEAIGTRAQYQPAPHVVYTSISGNGIRGQTQGLEAVATWHPTPHLRFQGSWATIDYHLNLAPRSNDTSSLNAISGGTPANEFKLSTQLDLGRHWRFDTFIWHQDELPALGISAYTGLNVRLAWIPTDQWEIELIGQDLLDREHAEFPPTFLGGATQEVPRTLRLSVTWRH